MSFLNRLKAAGSLLVGSRKFVGVNVFANDRDPFLLGNKGKDFINDGYRANPHVYSAINRIIDPVKRLPWRLYKKKSNSQASLRNYQNLIKSGNVIHAQRHKAHALDEVEGDHPLKQLMDRPNRNQGQSEFIANALGYKKLTGNSYIWGLSPDTGQNANRPQELLVLPAHFMKPRPSKQDIFEVAKYTAELGGKSKDFSTEEILHLKTWNPKFDANSGDHLMGQSPFQSARKVIQSSNDTYTALMKFMQNRGVNGAMVNKDATGSNEEALDRMEQRYREKYSRPHKRGSIWMLTGNWSWEEIGKEFDEMGFAEAHNMSREDIANVLGIGTEMLNDPNSKTQANREQARKDMIMNVSIPEIMSFRDELNRWLVPKYDPSLFLDVDVSGVPELQDDLKELSESLNKMYWITPNEKRVATGWPKDEQTPELDQYYIPSKLIPIGTARQEMSQSFEELFKSLSHAKSNGEREPSGVS